MLGGNDELVQICFLEYLGKAQVQREQNLEERTWFWGAPLIILDQPALVVWVYQREIRNSSYHDETVITGAHVLSHSEHGSVASI